MPRIHPTSPWVPEVNPSTDGPGVMALCFHDPAVRAELFDTRLHYDPQHLNADGAKVFTRMVAEEFAGLIKAKRGRSDE